jgi:hypothetical protein
VIASAPAVASSPRLEMNELIICFLLVKVVQLAVVAAMEALSAPP